MKVLLEVVRATQTEKQNFCLKLQGNREVNTPFGKTTQQVTYYMFTEQAPQVGFKAELELNQFSVVPKQKVIDGQDMTLKYLYPL